jgi:hypothetical protein
MQNRFDICRKKPRDALAETLSNNMNCGGLRTALVASP